MVEALKGDVLGAEGKAPCTEMLRVGAVLPGGHIMFQRLCPPEGYAEGARVRKAPEVLGYATVTTYRTSHDNEIPHFKPTLLDQI